MAVVYKVGTQFLDPHGNPAPAPDDAQQAETPVEDEGADSGKRGKRPIQAPKDTE